MLADVFPASASFSVSSTAVARPKPRSPVLPAPFEVERYHGGGLVVAGRVHCVQMKQRHGDRCGSRLPRRTAVAATYRQGATYSSVQHGAHTSSLGKYSFRQLCIIDMQFSTAWVEIPSRPILE